MMVGSMTNNLDFARQPDTKKFRLWEVPGSSHVGTYFYNIGIYDDGSEIVVKEMADAVRNLLPTRMEGESATLQ